MPGEFYIEGKQQKITLKDLSAEVAAIEAKLDREPAEKQSGTTVIDAAADFTALQTIIEDTETEVRHVGDIFIDLNLNGDPSAFHNRAIPGDRKSVV